MQARYFLFAALLFTSSKMALADPAVYVDQGADFSPANPSDGQIALWKSGTADETSVTIGTTGFTTVQAAIDAVDEGGTVFIASGTYLEGAEVLIDKSLILQGDGAGATVLSGNEAHRVVYTELGVGPTQNVFINDLNITDGNTSSSRGGGVFLGSNINLELNSVSISNNHSGSDGGGIWHQGSGLTVNNSDVSGNSAQDDGGGMYIDRRVVTINNTSITNNSAVDTGGAVATFRSDLTVVNSLIANNSAEAVGGLALLNGASIDLINSTVSGNVSTGDLFSSSAGGILIEGAIVCINSTITNNSSPNDIGGLLLDGGNRSIYNSIIAGNSGGHGVDDISSTSFTGSNNIIGLPAGVTDISEILAPLADNGGPTLTHALVAGSPALDAGANAEVPVDVTTDQRGAARISNTTVDIGAFELLPLPTLVSSEPAADGTGVTLDSVLTLTFDQAMVAGSGAINLRRSDTDEIIPATVLISGTTVTITPTSNLPEGIRIYLEIETDALFNSFNDAFAGINDPATLGFATCPAEVYVDAATDFTPANPAGGDLVTWKAGTAEAVSGLTFGIDAFSSVQAAVNEVCEGGTVFIAEGTYLEGAQIEIDKALTLQGEGAETTILSGNEAHRVISIIAGPAKEVVINDLWIRDGFLPSAFGGNPGTGIFVQANADLEVNRLVISDHVNDGGGGGAGIWHEGDELVVNECLIKDNTVFLHQGGGIYVRAGMALIYRTTISGNLVTLPPDREPEFFGSGSGGGIQINGAQVTIIESSITNNSVPLGNGGGISGFNFDSEVTIIDSSISNNTADQRGGGISWSGENALTLVNSTISGNVLTGSNLNTEFGGGGIFLGTYTGGTSQYHFINSTITDNQSPRGRGGFDRITRSSFTPGTIHNCVIAGNIDEDGIDDVLANWFTGSNNIIDLPPGVSDISEILAPLADNGGPTLTHALVAGSPALDTGANGEIPEGITTDQRGEGFPRIVGGTVDIGAFELLPAPTLVSSEPAADGVGVALDAVLTLTFDQAMVEGAGAIHLRRSDTDAIIPTSVLISGTSVIITPTSNLPEGIRIYLEIEADALLNGFSDAFGGIDDPATLGFTTCPTEVYVDAAADFSPASPATGDLVTWKAGTAEVVADLTFGIDAFSSAQAAVDAVCEDGTVFIAEGTYLEGVQIEIDQSLTLQGAGAEGTILSGNDAHRVILVSPASNGAPKRQVVLNDLSVVAGFTGGSNGSNAGAGILVGGFGQNNVDLEMNRVILSGNRSGNTGGGLSHSGDVLTINDSLITGNMASGAGGAGGILIAAGEAIMTRSRLIQNISSNGRGGGIYTNGSLTVRDSLIANNTTASDCGGVYSAASAFVTLINTTVSGNSAPTENPDAVEADFGAGLGLAGPFRIINSTITNNYGRLTGGGIGSNQSGSTNRAIHNSIIAGNRSDSPFSNSFVDIDPSTFTGSNNIIGLPAGVTDISEILVPLADNGGPTLTHALVPGSPALDGGANAEVPADVTTDQRGAGFPRILGGTVDIGAFEFLDLLQTTMTDLTFTPGLTVKIRIQDIFDAATGGSGAELSLVSVSIPVPGFPDSLSSARIVGDYIVYQSTEGQFWEDVLIYVLTDGLQTATGTIEFAPGEEEGDDPTLNIISITIADTAVIRAVGVPGQRYLIEYTDSFTPVDWTSFGDFQVCPPSGVMEFIDSSSLPGQRFYRVLRISAPPIFEP